jgi:hypothetical protein
MSEEKKLPDGETRKQPEEISQKEIPPEQTINKEAADKTPSSAESVAEAEPQSENLKLKPSTPETMEVHHHGHVHEKKKWKEYLFQFFMLFLAVFCGFLAEYQLEHIIENKREKQFMVSLVKDLERDTSQLESIIKYRIAWIRDIDSAISFTTAQKSDHIPLEKVQTIY